MEINRSPYLIGLTGSFGTGKSTVGDFINEYDKDDILVIDTDEIVREILSTKNPITDSLVKKLSAQILQSSNGFINRKILADYTFKNSEIRNFIEDLIHPEVKKILKKYISINKSKRFIVVLVPLLYESKMESMFNEVWCVVCDEKSQYERLLKKGYLKEDIELRINAQMKQNEKMKRADFIIDNSGDLNKTRDQISKKIKSMVQ